MAVSVNQARNFYIKNRDKFPGMSMTEAVDQMVRGGEIPVAPVETAPAATTPPPVPFQAAAAAAAPVAVAPEPEPEPAPKYMNPYEAALSAYNLANPETPAPVAAKGAPVDYAAMARQLGVERQRADLTANALISRETDIDPTIKDLIDKRQTRYDEELSQADKDRKQATWMAVAQAGLKMAQSQSPYFMQALATGMEAGINGYSESKAKAAEKKARLQEAKEDLVLKAKELRDQAVKDAINARLAGKQAAAADAELQQKTLAGVIGEQTAGEVIKSAALENRYKEAATAKIFSDIANDRTRLSIAREAARGGGGGINMKNAGQVVNSLVSENKTYAAILESPLASKGEKDQARQRMQANNRTIDYARSLQRQNLGMSSGFKVLGPA